MTELQSRILVVDDEEEIVSLIQEALEDEGYDVVTAKSGQEAIAAATEHLDLILLDVMMPDYDGYEVCKKIRDQVECPIVFLSARDRETDRVKGLIVGADDYLVKPFGIRELKARVHAHLRRDLRKQEAPRHILKFGELSIDLKGYTVSFREEAYPFTHREFEIIQLLAIHKGQVFSKDQIYEKVWGLEACGDSLTVTEHVKKVRAKLAIIDPAHTYISTIWGVGYKWDVVSTT